MRERSFRTATEDDLERVIEIHTAAYPDERGYAERRKNFLENPLGSIDDLHLCLEGDRVVGHAFLFSLALWIRGARVPAGGVASVGVAPEARKTGVARDLLEHLHASASARGDALTLLHPFRQAFYARSGYAQATPAERLVFAPRALPAWRADVRVPTSGEEIERLWTACAARSTGMLDRPRALWDRKHADERRTTLVTDGGYVAWELKPAKRATTRLLVHELVFTSDVAMRALAGAIRAQSDQVDVVELTAPRGSALALALTDADAHRSGAARFEDTLGAIVSGPMVRACSTERALALFPDVELRGDARAIGAVIFGGWRVEDARAIGLEVHGSAPAQPPFYGPDSF